jgi:Domain of unknown function (DU1801)
MNEWQVIFGSAPPDVRAIAQALRDLILSLHPDAVVVYRPGDRAVSYGWGPKKMSEAYAYLMPQRAWVNLGFYQGAVLSDHAGMLEGTGKALRHVKVRDAAAVSAPALRDLILAGLSERRAALGL